MSVLIDMGEPSCRDAPSEGLHGEHAIDVPAHRHQILSFAASVTSVATISRLPVATTACALQYWSKPPPATFMIRDSSSVRLTCSLSCTPPLAGSGGRPRGFLPVRDILGIRGPR
jgi:hypothetical protein